MALVARIIGRNSGTEVKKPISHGEQVTIEAATVLAQQRELLARAERLGIEVRSNRRE